MILIESKSILIINEFLNRIFQIIAGMDRALLNELLIFLNRTLFSTFRQHNLPYQSQNLIVSIKFFFREIKGIFEKKIISLISELSLLTVIQFSFKKSCIKCIKIKIE